MSHDKSVKLKRCKKNRKESNLRRAIEKDSERGKRERELCVRERARVRVCGFVTANINCVVSYETTKSPRSGDAGI